MSIRSPAIALLITLPTFAACDTQQACLEHADTQLAIDRCLQTDNETADQELNRIYRSVLSKHAGNPVFLEKLKSAQRAWLQWRDAELAARYPDSTIEGFYGSVLGGCQTSLLATLTRQRTQQLRQWLDGIEEGDVCAGSLPIKTSSPPPVPMP